LELEHSERHTIRFIIGFEIKKDIYPHERIEYIMKNETVLDLYCGPGGLGTGFSPYFQVLDAVDLNLDACNTYHLNHPETLIHNKPVIDFISSTIRKDFDGLIYSGVVGGPPCQEFSPLNQQKNYLSTRAQQLDVMIQSIIELQPNFALIENVATMPRKFKDMAVKTLMNAGYKVMAKIVNASFYHSVQARHRWILTCAKKKHVFPQPDKSNIKIAKSILTDEVSEMTMADSVRKGIKGLPIGKWVALPGQVWSGYYIVDPFKPLPVIINVMKNRLIKPDRSGYLSFNECKMAQGFPSDYQFFGGITSRTQQLANAVPVELAESFASAFYQSLFATS